MQDLVRVGLALGTLSFTLFALAVAIGMLARPRLAVLALLVMTVLVPVGYLVPPGAQQFFPPAFVGLVLVGLRTRASGALRQLPLLARFGFVGLAVVGLTSILYAPNVADPPLRALALIAVPTLTTLVVVRAVDDRDVVPDAWMKLGVVIALFALLEKFVVGFNPVFGDVFAAAGLEQRWSEYRVTTTLGHPLVSSLFFAVASAFALGRCLEGRDRRPIGLLAVNLLGLLLTLSRTGLVAFAAAALVVVVVIVLRGERSSVTKLLVLGVALVPAAYAARYVLSPRLSSDEAATSSEYRTEILRLALTGVREHIYLGYGADGLDRAGAELGLPSGNFENSYIDLALANGLPFACLWLLVAGALALVAARTGNYTGLAGIVAMCVAVAGFNFVFGHVAVMHLAGFVYATCVVQSRARSGVRALDSIETR